MIYGYARSSSVSRGLCAGIKEQERLLTKAGADMVISEECDLTNSHEVEKLLYTTLKEHDVITITSIDRIAKSWKEAMVRIEEILDKGAELEVLNLGRIKYGSEVYRFLIALVEADSVMISERTGTGREIAKNRPGYHDGRPKKYTAEQLDYGLSLLEKGLTYDDVTYKTDISKSTLVRYRKKRQKMFPSTQIKK